jgi:hypothetical protein
MLALPAIASAQNSGWVAGMKGSCGDVVLADLPVKCVSGLLYVHTGTGNAFFTVAMEDGRQVAFVGEKDSQPCPEAYYLYLSRVRISTKGSEFVSNIAAQCVTTMTRDGSVWSKITCEATDENGSRYALNFISDGLKISVERQQATAKSVQLDPTAVDRITKRFNTALQGGGITKVAEDIQACFDDAGRRAAVIKDCMLYDMAAARLDKSGIR